MVICACHLIQVEEETTMRKLYELMSAEGLLPKVHPFFKRFHNMCITYRHANDK
jgi:hypothetical protein